MASYFDSSSSGSESRSTSDREGDRNASTGGRSGATSALADLPNGAGAPLAAEEDRSGTPDHPSGNIPQQEVRTSTRVSGRVTDEEIDRHINDLSESLRPLREAGPPSAPRLFSNVTATSAQTTSHLPVQRSSEFSESIPRRAKNPVLGWSVRFSGSKIEGVNSFIRQVDELIKASGIEEQEFLSGAFHLFEGSALTWFRAYGTGVRSWAQLKSLLRADFLPLKYEDDLLMEILARRQGAEENITVYISCMIGLFKNLANIPPEKEQLRIILKNLAPFYLGNLKIFSITSLEQLKEEGKELEYKRTLMQEYNQPPSRHLLEPELAPSSTTSSPVGVYPMNVPSQASPSPRPSGPIKCWNCEGFGHSFSRCSQPRKTFCFRCGTPDVTKQRCPKCNRESGNANRNR